MIHVLVAENKVPLTEEQRAWLLGPLPHAMKEQAGRYRRWQDAQAYLLGRFLLVEGLKKYGLTQAILHEIRYTPFNKPYVTCGIEFNISHSGKYVVCALSQQGRIGIDIEEVQHIDVSEFNSQFREEELRAIQQAEDTYSEFFRYWTIKEAVIKADGRGLSIPLKDIVISQDVVIGGNRWYVHKLDIAPQYIAHLVADLQTDTKINVERITLPVLTDMP